MKHRVLDPEGGFTLAEIVMATAIVAVGFVSVAIAFQYALSSIETGRAESTAILLAERRLEELKAVALVDWANADLAAATRTEFCLPTGGGCTAAATPGSYKRATTVTDGTGGACTTRCKLVRVTVSYRAITGGGQLGQERRVDLLTLFVSRT